ncbi:MAG: sugar phosphate isomerase/epimerase family protein [Angustibacter sp.]
MTSSPPAPAIRVSLSTASTYPESCATAFELASRLGYDGIEVMVWTDPVSQDPDALRRLSDHYQLPVVAIHAPTLLITQRVWGIEPWPKLERSCAMARAVGAGTVVVHPPFRWQREYAAGFETGLRDLAGRTGVRLAVENMFPWRTRRFDVQAYLPSWDPTGRDYDHVTLDLSHTATAGSDALAMADALGDRLVHVHLADGSGSGKDEHLVPGRGGQPCAELLELLASRDWGGEVVVEITTRRARTRADREADLIEALAFARLNLAAVAPAPPDPTPRP